MKCNVCILHILKGLHLIFFKWRDSFFFQEYYSIWCRLRQITCVQNLWSFDTFGVFPKMIILILMNKTKLKNVGTLFTQKESWIAHKKRFSIYLKAYFKLLFVFLSVLSVQADLCRKLKFYVLGFPTSEELL
jgi:hypothetical protein